MKISELLRQRPTLSFEIFPPKNKDGDISSIYSTIDQLAQLKPDFISVTYGAGGSTTRNTVEIATMIKERWQIESVAHLSCIDATAENLREAGEFAKGCGVRIALENIDRSEPLCDPVLLPRLVDRIGLDNVGYCLDAGHAHCAGNSIAAWRARA